jgi:hypothetical protein
MAGPVDRVMEKIAADVEKVGWSAIGVFPTGEGGAPFTYTIGLVKTLEHPELIVYGLEHKQAHSILWSAIELIKTEEVKLEPGKRYARVIQDLDVEMRAGHPSGRPANAARRFYEGDVALVQLVLPDSEGRFPGEDGCDPMFELWQTPSLEDVEPSEFGDEQQWGG